MNSGNYDLDSPERINYFNYFTEVEEEFVRRRGKPLLVSPLDWALIESWKELCIPLHVVLRAINQAFDGFEARPGRHARINSILYCQQAVEQLFADYRLAQVGAAQDPDRVTGDSTDSGAGTHGGNGESSPFSREAILDFLHRSDLDLELAQRRATANSKDEVAEAIARGRARLVEMHREAESLAAPNAEQIEHDLDAIDRLIMEAIANSLTVEEHKALEKTAASALKKFRKTMAPDVYERTVVNLVARTLRDSFGVPRLSLFYLPL